MDSRIISKVIVHCSDSPDDRDIGFEEIDQWHQDRGWSGVLKGDRRIYCGYHWIIRRDGTIEEGRPEHSIGAHCRGQNKESIGVCWIGRDKPEEKQMDSLISLLLTIQVRYGLLDSDVKGHSEFTSSKTCPNLNMIQLRKQLETAKEGGRAPWRS